MPFVIKSRQEQTEQQEELRKLREENADLSRTRQRLELELHSLRGSVDGFRARLQEMPVVDSYHQPVLLMGPSSVGKTSLIRQLEARWKPRRVRTSPSPTPAPSLRPVSVPVGDCFRAKACRHPLDEQIQADLQSHLVLDFFDFPGEPSGRKAIIQAVCLRTTEIFDCAGLGVILICMFNADEAARREPLQPTKEYYDRETVLKLRDLVVLSKARIERLILVFNKVDLLRERRPRFNDADVRDLCREFFLTHFRDLEDLSRYNSDPEVAGASASLHEPLACIITMLNQEAPDSRIQGASEVLGAASSSLLRKFGGESMLQEILSGSQPPIATL